MEKVKQKDLILYSGLIILGLAAPYLFSAFKVQLTYLCVLIVLAMTWNLQGGETVSYTHLTLPTTPYV